MEYNYNQRQNGGKPLKYSSPDAMAEKLKGFEEWCNSTNRVLLIEWLLYYLEIDAKEKMFYLTLDGYNENGEYNQDTDYAKILKRACDMCTGWLANNGVTGTWRDAVTIFLLKQQGYTDRTEMSVDNNITIKLPDDGLND